MIDEPFKLTIGGREVEFPAKVPLGIAPAFQMERIDLLYKILARGDEKLTEHLIVHMTEENLKEVFSHYGILGESQASGD